MASTVSEKSRATPDQRRAHRRRRFRRRGRRAYIRSVYFLPSMATLGNAICGFGSMYIAGLGVGPDGLTAIADPWTRNFAAHSFTWAAYLIFFAMIFDALDGRLARLTRHTTDFGGQLDSLADVISFGAAPAFLALQVFKGAGYQIDHSVSRAIWAIGAIYMSCAALRLARFNVSNEHGEQHHFSFLGLPSPGAGGAIAAFVLMIEQLRGDGFMSLASVGVWILPVLVLGTGLLMISEIRYPHVVNRYLRGRRSIMQLVVVVGLILLLITKPRYTLGISLLAYVLWGLWLFVHGRIVHHRMAAGQG
jgi:CDP-diacylglycerol--serine O-phosphatidyltransferase